MSASRRIYAIDAIFNHGSYLKFDKAHETSYVNRKVQYGRIFLILFMNKLVLRGSKSSMRAVMISVYFSSAPIGEIADLAEK